MSTHHTQSAQHSIAAETPSLKQGPQNLAAQTHSTMQQPSNESGRNTPGLHHPFPTVDLQSLSVPSDVNHRQSANNNDLDAFASAFPEFDSSASPYIPSDIDWLLSSTNDTLAAAAAPAPDQFERDLEQALAGFEPSQLNYINNLNTVDFSQQQFFLHRGAPTSLSHPGPLSAITASSESAYGDDRSESHYNPYSPQGSLVNAANPSHFNAAIYQALENFTVDLASFGLSDSTQSAIQPSQTTRLPLNNPIQPPSVNFDQLMPSSTASGHSFSSFEDSGMSLRDTSPNDRSNNSDDGEREFGTSTNLNGNYQQVPPQSAIDPRKKYQCPNCPRGSSPFVASRNTFVLKLSQPLLAHSTSKPTWLPMIPTASNPMYAPMRDVVAPFQGSTTLVAISCPSTRTRVASR
ncbi:hypothetical protein M408DRAFT_128068 [Serendipita vermifera MAFF 305830]|uniref:Uncharacterized protein n=1 Tax=Serendipita vermifera MAFF 305830 TaxID=933852 RepID=A0A0C2XJ73_SERVB|nr:hypothetical protein M408DRAFT_128068 [Serendipita vermifera MAFF 305830]